MAQQTRKDPRAKVLSMTVRYKSATLDEFIEHHSHDVSRGGMFIKTPQPFPPGTLLKFEVRIAEDRKVMQGVGRVVWKRDNVTADAERPSGMGVKFIKLDDESRLLIDQLLTSRQDESSAFDAEGAADVDGEAPVGLGLSGFAAAESKPLDRGNSFFPNTENAPLPAPEDRTVMKQASELLEEALREVGADSGAAEPKPISLAPAGDDSEEDTKPGRPSRSVESLSRLPATKGSVSGSEKPSLPGEKVKVVSEAVSASKLVAAAKATVVASRPLSTKPDSPKPLASERKSAGPVTSSSSAPRPSMAVKFAPSKPASGRGRGVVWLLAVAASVGGVYWLTRPKPVPAPLPENVTVEQPVPAAVTPSTEASPQPEPIVPAAAPVVEAAASAVASAAPAVESAQPPVVAAAPVATPPAKPVTVTKAVTAKPKADKSEEPTEAPAAVEPPAVVETAPAVSKPVEAKPPAPTEPAAPAPTPAPAPKKAKAAETDNPY